MTFPIIQVLLSIAVSALIVFKVIVHGDRCTFRERLGMTLTAASLILNIGPILANITPFGCPPTPFDNWGSAMMRIGLGLYFWERVNIHRRNNRKQIKIAEDHFAAKAKS